MDGVNTIVSIVVGIAGIAGFVLTMIDRHKRSGRPRTDSAEPSATTVEMPGTAAGSSPAAIDRARAADGTIRRRSGVHRLLLSPLVFFAAFLGAGLLAAVVDDPSDAVDLSAIAGWSVACSATLAWVYFAVRAITAGEPRER